MSQAPSGYERKEGDAYYTPDWVTEALISVETFKGDIFDPGAGEGHILEVFRKRGLFPVYGMEINTEITAPWYVERGDFLKSTGTAPNIVGNPPYGVQGRLAVQFIEHSLELTRLRVGKVAMLLRVDFDSANGRRHIFKDHPAFLAKYTLTKRIRWANLEQSKSGPTENHAWFVWDWQRRPLQQRIYDYLPYYLP